VTEVQRFQEKQWGLIVARAWADDEFRARLLSNAAGVMREHGLEVPPDAEIRVVVDSPDVRHFVLPASPTGDLSEEELSPVAGADSFSWLCGRCGRCGCGRCGCDAM
jgi:nitrile hydratase alpha subunit